MADEGVERRLREAALLYAATRPPDRAVVDFTWAAQFTFEGRRVSLLDAQRGIRKPALLRAALSIRTVWTPPQQEPPYGRPGGMAVVPNGLSMCKIHHAAYDHDILGITPDLVVQVRTVVLAEIDGPMLKHGTQEMHGQRLRVLPSQRVARPDRDRLAQQYEEFRAG